ncbi:MAG: insulinase family protein [Alphaproteobacteria bacterium]
MLTGLTELEEDPEYLAGRAFDAASFAGHPYASAPDGTPRSLAAIAPQDVRDFLHGHLARGNVLIAAAGDVDEDTLDDVLGKTLDALPQDAKDAAPVAQVQLQGAGTALSVAKTYRRASSSSARRRRRAATRNSTPPTCSTRYWAPTRWLSRLGQVVRKEKGLVYNVTTELDMRSGASLLRGSLATRSETAALATQAVTDTLAAVRDKGVTAEECSEARTYVLGAFPRELDGSQSVAGTLLMMRIWHLGPDYIAKRQGYFDAVRCEDIDALAAQLLDPKKFLFVTVGRSAAAQGAAK